MLRLAINGPIYRIIERSGFTRHWEFADSIGMNRTYLSRVANGELPLPERLTSYLRDRGYSEAEIVGFQEEQTQLIEARKRMQEAERAAA